MICAAEAMDSSGMSLEEVLRTHLDPRLDAKKIVSYRYRGRVTKIGLADPGAQLETIKLALQVHGVLPYE